MIFLNSAVYGQFVLVDIIRLDEWSIQNLEKEGSQEWLSSTMVGSKTKFDFLLTEKKL